MKRVFVSDLHLDQADSEIFQAFAGLLRAESAQVDEIYILGDLVEMWIGDDDTSATALALLSALQQASKSADIFLQHGNRDFLFGQAFCQQTGATLLPDPFVLGDILLSHGDLFCTDDVAYQEVRQLLRSADWQSDLMQRSLPERQQLGRQMRAQSMAANANKSDQIMDVNLSAVAATMAEQGTSTLIHGHTHRPGDYPRRGASAFRRVVLGDWQDCGWLCRQDGTSLSLECFNLARYQAS
ncbi:MAG: UDP-2,3-diacylglucosamine diphosphatase [Proteobacteria bacterium]|nr:UDP-2,3-diacylglucosamine diphosphatase [Pseudomonadota bacterium]